MSAPAARAALTPEGDEDFGSVTFAIDRLPEHERAPEALRTIVPRVLETIAAAQTTETELHDSPIP